MAHAGGEGYGSNRSAEWRYWRNHYRAKGCAENKVMKLVCKKMGYR